MPLYVYRRADKTTFEIEQRMSDEPLTQCPTTGQPCERVLMPFGIAFKGPGFHNTDYGTRKRPAETSAGEA